MDTINIINELKFYMNNFKRVNDTTWNFSCPVCGDSKKFKNKARGYIYLKNGNYNYTCKNCDAGMSVNNFIKTYADTLYQTYIFRSFVKPKDDGYPLKEFTKVSKVSIKEYPFLIPYWESNLALDFINKRKIPKERLNDVFFIEDINVLIKKHQALGYNLIKPSSRLVFVVRAEDTIVGFITRALDPKDIRYYNIKIDSKHSLLYGTTYLDFSKTVWIVEGIIDSLFLDNSLAANSSSFSSAIEYCQKRNLEYILVYDNEPYNTVIRNTIEKAIEEDNQIVIYTNFNLKGKDLNEMILKNEITPKELQAELSKHVASGLLAKLEFSRY